MRKLLSIVLFLPLLTNAQIHAGINFEENLSWEQIKSKAKAENKYIFLDCYTTWCGPCKRMDKEVYTNDIVGNYFNDKFVSVKVQMDKTEKDNEKIQSWYADARLIEKQYRIMAYPSFVFLTPEGTIIHKETGFKLPDELITAARTAISPGKIYDDPYAVYDKLLLEYKLGNKNYDSIPFMFKAAAELGETEITKALESDYNEYLLTLNQEKLYTRKNIEYIASVINSKSRFFHLFFPDGTKVNEIMRENNYAETVVDQVILIETIEPFLQIKTRGLQISGSIVQTRPDPDWQQLYNIIKNKYNENYALRNVLEAQIIWYEHQQNYNAFAKHFIAKWEKYRTDTIDTVTDSKLNAAAWKIFLHCTGKAQLEAALKWMKGVVRRSFNTHPVSKAAYIDTYAALLYKSGKRKDAIQWEEKAVDIAINEIKDKAAIQFFQDVVNQMKRGKPTWIVK